MNKRPRFALLSRLLAGCLPAGFAEACFAAGGFVPSTTSREGGDHVMVACQVATGESWFACSFALDAASASDGSPWLMIMPAGTFQLRDGRGPFSAGDQTAMRAIVERSRAYVGSTDMVVDYDHQTVFAAVPGVGGRAPAAGWIQAFEVRSDGIWAQVSWTDAARAAIRAGEYRYLSPVFMSAADSSVVNIINVALTNQPALDLAGAVSARASLQPSGAASMKKIAEILGLNADATEEQILVACRALKDGSDRIAVAAGVAAGTSAEAIATAVQTLRSTTTTAAASVDPAAFVPRAEFDALSTRLGEIEKSSAEDKATAAVDAAIAEGKVTPASRDWAMSYAAKDFEGFQTFAASAPVLVKPGAVAARTAAAASGKGDKLTEDELQVCKALGIKPEDFQKTRKIEA